MGGGAGVRVVHGTIAAAAALLATAASTVDIGDKLHLKVTPILFYAVPISIPLPPLSSLSGACGCTDRSSFSVSYSRILPSKECEASSFASASSSISPPGATAGKGQNFQGWRPYMSVLQLYTEPPLTPTKLSTCVAKVQCSIHLEPLVSTLSSFQYSLQNHSSQHSQTLRTRHVAIEGNFKLDSNDDDLEPLSSKFECKEELSRRE
ncbi:uncharacterized protein [Physcomitrium patens]|uniref:Uncharacterized protein n=1 Tax=Physcomitrium patens TaxID=3218 RepID=A0A2K1IGI1_PHYPA|nr:uncharacterized protein LOC112276651 isoform X2 [Physcomitrium patens]PNR28386.1 hypothetical protein PHYPA_028978 [Physcomitrium patens]|eukprot:XP_024363911.1 uncharacterized protein LOC112276651 isoform X2 [Physcomitrella patens]